SVASIPVETLPAIAAPNRTVLLAESVPPQGADGTLLLARVDKLLDIGALDDAQALLERAGPTTPALFRRWFDVALLTGTEDLACRALRSNGDIATSYQARIFCLARNGDWNAAVLTLNSAESLGVLSAEEYDLLARFLDPELFEGDIRIPLPASVTPLVYRLFEAIGEPIATGTLPRAFAYGDLRMIASWPDRIAAAERLAQVGAIAENRLLGIYSERNPLDAGDLGGRVAALQRFDQAITTRAVDMLSQSLPPVWRDMKSARLERVFAQLYAEPLLAAQLQGEAERVSYELSLLSDQYEIAAQAQGPLNRAAANGPMLRFLGALALGIPASAPAPSLRASAVRDGFDDGGLEAADEVLLAEGRLGEAILAAGKHVGVALNGDTASISQALRLLRKLGLEDAARQTALQFLLLERRG
ncbi:MAG: hypothetical protein ACC631_08125, partial [Halocynthiibacter sp.]